jgi:predicted DNA-binding transcriptional regulator AlpA
MSRRSAARAKKARPSAIETKRRAAQRQKPKPAYTLLVDAAAPVELKEQEPGSTAEALSYAQHSRPPPRTHHLDKRAAGLLAAALGSGNMDDLLTTKQVAPWLNISTQWLEIGRVREYGPKYVRLSQRCVRYRRGDVLDWLAERTHSSTGEYTKVGGRG